MALVGCAGVEVGRDFDLKTFEARVKHKETTRAEVNTWLGSPSSTGTVVNANGERYEKWNYYYGTGSAWGKEPARVKLLEVQFDSNGRVISYNWAGD
jgi:hypothetical protein